MVNREMNGRSNAAYSVTFHGAPSGIIGLFPIAPKLFAKSGETFVCR